MKKLIYVLIIAVIGLGAFFWGKHSAPKTSAIDQINTSQKNQLNTSQTPNSMDQNLTLSCQAEIDAAMAMCESSTTESDSSNAEKMIPESLVNEKIKQAVSQTTRSLTTDLFKARMALDEANNKLRKAGFEVEQAISQAEIDENLPAPFNAVAGSMGSYFLEKYADFVKEEQNYEWAIVLETQITDFINLHEFSSNIKLIDVNCGNSKCEIYGFFNDKLKYQLIVEQMKEMPWYTGTLAQSFASRRAVNNNETNDDEAQFNDYFFILDSFK